MVLITGGAGFIGAQTVLAHLDAGREAAVVDDLSTGVRASVPSAARFTQAGVADVAGVTAALRESGARAVIHFAASANAPASVGEPLAYYRNNVGALLNLLEACAAAGVERFVFSSTAAVYGEAQGVVDETAPVAPVSPYGRSKLMAEGVLADVAAATGLRVAALRYFNVSGADPAGRAGQSTPGATHLFKAACRAALGRAEALEVYGADWPTRDGSGVRDYVHVEDIARAHLLALDRLERLPAGAFEVFNLGSGSGFSVHEVAEAVGRAAGRPVPLRLRPRRPGDMAEVVASNARAHDVLGWSPRHDLDTIAAHALRWERTAFSA